MNKKVLIVDDDKNICEILEFNLKNENYYVECAYSAEEALVKLKNKFDIILLDVMMGRMSGYKLAETINAKENNLPIIFITAKDTENDMLTGFSVGADDYISKPFSINEVIARVKAVIKRYNKNIDNIEKNKIIFDNIVIDLKLKELYIKSEKIDLTKTEFELLALLAEHPDSIFSREDLINKIWTETPFITERTVDVHITRLRKKLGEYSHIIINRSGYGYRFSNSKL